MKWYVFGDGVACYSFPSKVYTDKCHFYSNAQKDELLRLKMNVWKQPVTLVPVSLATRSKKK